ncbi:MAG: 3-deoxy-D-manno-octulosonic acid transferase, partial [Alphaproteobacteria bacterium]|nr:3-deoxy-D-manno-octulosonic acid transferase [Alphaproteobacteria bacterium]
MLLGLYHFLTQRFAFLIRWHLKSRVKKGKEDPNRLTERYGQASIPRPQGQLIWIHAASMGESMSTLAFIEKLLKTCPNLHILMTTGTLTSAKTMRQVLPKDVIHQYNPLDAPSWVEEFLNYWHPDLVLWLESELWPNMIQTIHTRAIPLFLLNGRISDQTYKYWLRLKNFIAPILRAFHVCFAQSAQDQERLEKLGAPYVITAGNLKFSARPLAVDEKELQHMRSLVKGRQVWLAASTHEGEEAFVAQAHQLITNVNPEALCIVIPRHPERAARIVEAFKNFQIARRSKGHTITPQTQIYIADTLNELGLFYRLAPVAFIGGSLVPIGGHNLIEPLQLDCVPIHGPFMAKTREIAAIFKNNSASFEIQDAGSLAQAVQSLFASPELYRTMVRAGHHIIVSQAQVIERIFKELLP